MALSKYYSVAYCFYKIVVAILIYHCAKYVTAYPKATPFHVNTEKYRYNISVS